MQKHNKRARKFKDINSRKAAMYLSHLKLCKWLNHLSNQIIAAANFLSNNVDKIFFKYIDDNAKFPVTKNHLKLWKWAHSFIKSIYKNKTPSVSSKIVYKYF